LVSNFNQTLQLTKITC